MSQQRKSFFPVDAGPAKPRPDDTADELLAALRALDGSTDRPRRQTMPSSPGRQQRTSVPAAAASRSRATVGQELEPFLPQRGSVWPGPETPPAIPGGQALSNLPLVPPKPPGKAPLPSAEHFISEGDEDDEEVEGLPPGLPGVTTKHVDQAFQEIDFDANGFIGVNELRYLLCTMGERPTDEELDEMVRMLDTEGLGQVSREAFGSIFSQGHPVLLEMVSHAPAPVVEEEQKRKRGKTPEVSEQTKMLLMEAASTFMAAGTKKGREERRPVLPRAKGRARATRGTERDSMISAPQNPPVYATKSH